MGSKKKFIPNDFSDCCESIRENSISFPTTRLGKFIADLKCHMISNNEKLNSCDSSKNTSPRGIDPNRLDAEGALNLNNINTLEEYISGLFNVKIQNKKNIITEEVCNSMIENAIFWKQYSNYNFDQLIIIQLSQLAYCQCVVLSKHNLVLDEQLSVPFETTQITTGYNVKSVLWPRK